MDARQFRDELLDGFKAANRLTSSVERNRGEPERAVGIVNYGGREFRVIVELLTD